MSAHCLPGAQLISARRRRDDVRNLIRLHIVPPKRMSVTPGNHEYHAQAPGFSPLNLRKPHALMRGGNEGQKGLCVRRQPRQCGGIGGAAHRSTHGARPPYAPCGPLRARSLESTNIRTASSAGCLQAAPAEAGPDLRIQRRVSCRSSTGTGSNHTRSGVKLIPLDMPSIDANDPARASNKVGRSSVLMFVGIITATPGTCTAPRWQVPDGLTFAAPKPCLEHPAHLSAVNLDAAARRAQVVRGGDAAACVSTRAAERPKARSARGERHSLRYAQHRYKRPCTR